MCHGRASAGWRWQHSSSLSPGVCRKKFLDSCRADVVPVWLVDSGASRPYLVQIKDLGHFGAPRWPPGSCRTLKKSPMLPLFEYNTQGQDRGPRQAARRFFLSGGVRQMCDCWPPKLLAPCTVLSGLSHVARATTLGSSVTRGRSGLPGGLVPQPSCTSSACWCPESQVGQRLTTQTRVRHRAARSVHHCHCGRFYELLPGSPPVLSPVPGVMVLVTHSELRFAVTEPMIGRERPQSFILHM